MEYPPLDSATIGGWRRTANVIFIERTLGNADREKIGAQLDLLSYLDIKSHRSGIKSRVSTFGPKVWTRRHSILTQGERFERENKSILSGIGEPRVDDSGLTLGEDTTAATTTASKATTRGSAAPTWTSPSAILTTSTSTASLHDLVQWKLLERIERAPRTQPYCGEDTRVARAGPDRLHFWLKARLRTVMATLPHQVGVHICVQMRVLRPTHRNTTMETCLSRLSFLLVPPLQAIFLPNASRL